jgi:fibronectin type 3 domain-containing protein
VVDVPLQPLRIPTGWLVTYNDGLYEIDPRPDAIPSEDRRLIFKEDMLQMKHIRTDRLLDLGWYPEGDLENGGYGLVIYQGDFRGRLLHEFSTRDRATLVAEIERLLNVVGADGM